MTNKKARRGHSSQITGGHKVNIQHKVNIYFSVMETQSAKIFNVSFDGSQPVVALVGKKRYTFIARFRGLIGETLFAAMDEKNN